MEQPKPNNDNAFASFARQIIRWRYLVIIGTVAIALLIASGGRFLGFTSNYRVFFGETNPFLEAYETIQRIYSKNDNILFVLEPEDGQVFTNSMMQAVAYLTSEAWKVPHSYRVDSLTNFQHIEADEEGLVVADLVAEGELTQAQLDKIKQVALKEPLLENALITEKTNVTAVAVSIRVPDDDETAVTEMAAYARTLRDEFKSKHPGIEVYLTGTVMLSNSFPEISQRDMSTLVPLMYVVIIVLSVFFLRSFAGTFGTLLVIILSTITTMGLMGWTGVKLTPLSASVPTIVLTLAVADSVHILMTVIQSMRKGMSRHEAIVESMRVNFMPVTITSVTTAIGFMGLNLSDAPPFHDLGNYTAAGVMFAFFFSVTFLPALIAILPMKVKVSNKPGMFNLDGLAEFTIKNRKPLLWGTTALVLVMVALLPRLVINDNFIDYFAKGFEFRDDSDFAIENLTGVYTVEYSLGSGGPSAINEPEYMAKVEEFATWLRAQPEVKNVNVITDTMKRLNKSMNADNPEEYKIPGQRDLIAQYLLLYEMSLPLGLDLNNQIDVDKSATRVVVSLDKLTTSELQGVKERSEVWLRENAPESMFSEGASTSMMFTYITRTNAEGLLFGTLLSIGLITLTLLLTFRSAKFGLLSLIPNTLPIILTFGLWAIIDGEISVAAATVATITIGIVVDDTVHFLSKYLRARREQQLNPANAVRYAFSTVGVALTATTLILVFGFMVLSASIFKMNVQMGVLTTITIIFALVVDFLFLPALLIKLEGEEGVDDVYSLQPNRLKPQTA